MLLDIFVAYKVFQRVVASLDFSYEKIFHRKIAECRKMQILCFLAYPISYEVMKDVVCIIAKTKTSECVRKCIACLCCKGVLFLLLLLSMTCKCMRYCCRCSLIRMSTIYED